MSHVDSLRDDTSKALQSSQDLIRSYEMFARMMDCKLWPLAQRGGQVFPDPDITHKFEEISGHSSALIKHAMQMQARLVSLVMMLDGARDDQRATYW